MTKLTGVGFVLSLGHNSPEGVRHGHSNDTFLPDALQLAENLAEHIGMEMPGCVAVDCDRPLERIYARWEAAAIADTHAKRGDAKQAPSLMSGGGDAKRQSPVIHCNPIGTP